MAGAPDDLRPRRSILFVPASNPRALDKARGLACDAVILDLEDAVAPDAKPAARQAAVEAVAQGFPGKEVVVRCNGLETAWGADDLWALAEAGPDAVLAPKVRSAADVAAYDQALATAPERTRLWCMIETPGAVLNLNAIAGGVRASRLSGLVLGLNDLALELRLRLGPGRAAAQPILSQAVVTARAHRLLVFDGVFNGLEDPEGFAAECRQGADFGFDGKTLIHPGQIEACNRAFSPSPDEAAWARAVVEAFAAPGALGQGALRLQGRMIERLHLKEAERLLRLAEGASPSAAG